MFKILFGSWLVILFFLGVVCFGFGFYQSVNPGFAAGLVTICYELGTIMLFFWLFIALVEKMNS